MECGRVNAVLSKQIAAGRLTEAQRGVLDALDTASNRLERVCAGLLLNNLAAGLQMSGRLDEARTYAERAVKQYQTALPASDSAYLAPLHTIATVDLEQGQTTRARQVLLKMRHVYATDPEDRVLILTLGASLLVREGKHEEAKSQFLNALSALTEAGKQNSADASTIRGQLACLYLQEQRFHEAVTLLNTALSMLDSAQDEKPLNRIKLLNARGVAWARLHHWRNSESDLAWAVSLCREQRSMDSAELESILRNYAYALKKMHRRQARSVKNLAAAIQSANAASRHVVDFAELAASLDHRQ